MVVASVDELFQERGDPAFAETFEAVFREYENNADPSARLMNGVIIIPDGIEIADRAQVSIGQEVICFIDDENESRMFDHVLQDFRFPGGIFSENSRADLFPKSCLSDTGESPDIRSIAPCGNPVSCHECFSSSGRTEHVGKLSEPCGSVQETDDFFGG